MKAVRGTIYPVSGPPIPNAAMLFDEGKIVAIGPADRIAIPTDAEVIEPTGMVITPGLVDAHTHAGLWPEWYGPGEDDANELGDPVTPEVRAIDAVWPEHSVFADARSGGVTTVQTTPGGANCIGGEMLCVKTTGRTIDDMLLKCPTGMKAALGENPKRFYGQALRKAPMTRMGSAAIIRDTLYKASACMKKTSAAVGDPSRVSETDPRLLGLIKVLRHEMPLRIHAHRADDIVTAVRIAEEFGIDYSIEHCTDGAAVAEFLGRRHARVNLGPLLCARPKVEMAALAFTSACMLDSAGCKVSIITDHPMIPLQHLISCAALACGAGMPEDAALRAVTLTPAQTIGVADRVGSIEPGKDADFVIWSGHPFRVRSRVAEVYVNGESVYSSAAAPTRLF